MKKKILTCCLILTMIFSSVPIYAMETEETSGETLAETVESAETSLDIVETSSVVETQVQEKAMETEEVQTDVQTDVGTEVIETEVESETQIDAIEAETERETAIESESGTEELLETEEETNEDMEADSVSGIWKYTVNKGVATITGLANPDYSMDIHLDIPASVAGYPVTVIRYNAFEGNLNIKSVSFAKAKNLTTIQSNAFRNCTNLEGTITLPANITTMGGGNIERGIFDGTSISKLVVEEGSNELRIAEKAFINCKALTTVVLSARVTHIGASAFSGASSLSSFTWKAGSYEQSIGERAFQGTALTSFKAQSSLVSIGDFAFAELKSLKSIELNEGLESIGWQSFANCNNLTGTVTIPSTVKKIYVYNGQGYTFANTAIKKVVFKKGNVALDIPTYAFRDCKQLHTVELAGNIVNIGDHAFQGAVSLENFSWADGTEERTIGSYAFNGTRLTKFVAPTSLVRIGSYAFNDVTTLTTLVLNDVIKEIDTGAFKGCVNLTGKLTLPGTLTLLGDWSYSAGAFQNTAITEVEIKSGNQKLNIDQNTFRDCKKLKKVTLSGRVAEIYASAFRDASVLTTFTWADGNYDQTIGDYAFTGTKLTSFNMPKRLISIGTGAFSDCTTLKSLTVNNAIQTIGNYAFKNCTGLTGTLSLPASLTTLARNNYNGPFENTGYSTVIIADGYEDLYVGGDSFFGCKNLKKVVLPGRTTNLTSTAFNNCPKLESLTIKDIVVGDTFETLPEVKCDGYAFDGWYTPNGNKAATTTEIANAGVNIVYSKWKANEYTLRFNAMSGTVSTSSKKVTYGSKYGTLPTPTRDKYEFVGWYTDRNGGEKVTSNTIVNHASDRWLYAHWEKTGGVEKFVTRLYEVCLSRTPDTAGLNDWVKRLENGRETGISAAYGFIFSNEFKSKNLCNKDFVKQLYLAFMGRTADSAGLKDWVNRLENGATREEVFNGFALSNEFKTICSTYGIKVGNAISVPQYGTVPTGKCSVCGAEDGVTGFVKRLYKVCLGRTPDNAGLKDWTNKLWNHTMSGRKVAFGFIFSKEFSDKKYSNAEYVERLYEAFMGRSSDAAGKADWLKRMKNGWTREDVFDGFVGSQEFMRICNSYGIVRD